MSHSKFMWLIIGKEKIMEKSSFEPRYKYNLGRLKMGFERIYMFDNRDIVYQKSCIQKIM